MKTQVQRHAAAGKLTTLVTPRARCVAMISTALLVLSIGASVAQAETPGPGWELSGKTFPTNLGRPISEVQEAAVNSEDYREARQAFLEKRTPKFR